MDMEPNTDPLEQFTLSQPIRNSPDRSRFVSGCLVGLAVAGAISVVMCCGGGIALVRFGAHVIGEEIASQLREDPILVDRLGPIERIEIDVFASMLEEGAEVSVFDVEGTRGKGVIYCESHTSADGLEQIVWAELRLPDGETVDLIVEEE